MQVRQAYRRSRAGEGSPSLTWLRSTVREERPSMVSTLFQKERSLLKARQSKSRWKAETAT